MKLRKSALRQSNAALVTLSLLAAIWAPAALAAVAWQEGNTYTAGSVVSYNGHDYKALVTHTAYVGANWNPSATPTLWQDQGPVLPPPTSTPTPSPTPYVTITPTPTPVACTFNSPQWSVGQNYPVNSCVTTRYGSSFETCTHIYAATVAHLSTSSNGPGTASWIQQDSGAGLCVMIPFYTPTPVVTVTPSPTPTPTSTPTPTITVTPTPGVITPVPGLCAADWNTGTAYTGGANVAYNGRNYQAKWWTQGNIPSANVGDGRPWNDLGACSSNAVSVIAVATPTEGQSFSYGDYLIPITLSGSASETGGQIVSIKVTIDGTLVTQVNGASFSVLWGPYSGNHQMVVTATDARGAVSTLQRNFKVTISGLPTPYPTVTPTPSTTPTVTPTPTSTPTPTVTPTPPICPPVMPPAGYKVVPDPAYPCGKPVPIGDVVNFGSLSATPAANSQYNIGWTLNGALLPGWTPGYWRVLDATGKTVTASGTIIPSPNQSVTYYSGNLTTAFGSGTSSFQVQVCDSQNSNNCILSQFAPLGSTTLAKHLLVGYWHNFPNASGPTFPLSQIADDWDVIMLSFGENAGNGNVAFHLDQNAGSEAQFIADIAAKRAKGKKVVLSLGGQDGSITLNTAADVGNFVSSLNGLITKYGLDGIDLDLESGVSQGAAIQGNLVTAIKQLKALVGPSFYLSMAPEHPYVQGGYVALGGNWGSYLPIIDGLRDDLSVIHVQYYNNGGFTFTDGRTLNEGTVDGLVGGSLMLIEGFKTAYGTGWEFKGLRPDQVAFGVPSGNQSAGRGFVTAATVKNALTCLTQLTGCDTVKPKQAYPTYRGVMTWSINWDKHDGYNFSVPARAALNALP
ncbi:Chitinase D [Andreprevotia sp. IGB-42]|uniref:carbohydrate-binding protein n=1 Tax=Andreprevotia sp. IGB-42 TaxID=2497473 RepID=UPI00135B4810|nr:carbohydrate-binding protein [Andreprevotia sp. IGB-42]KAF0811561.1 Chitinase D [Andreprevotia sp. IGB-42]